MDEQLPNGVTEIYNDFFELSKIDVAIPPTPLGEVVTVRSDMTVRDAVRLLASKNIHSAPIHDVEAAEDSAWLDKYIGTVDTENLMYWLLDKVEGVPPESLHDLLEQEFANAPVTDVVGADPFSTRFSPFVPLEADSNTMLDVMLLLGRYALHKAYEVKAAGDIVNVITQSAVVKFLSKHKDMMVSTTNRTLDELKLAQKAPITVNRDDDTFWTAFKLMRDKSISAVPVVDTDGTITGVVSCRDARLMVTRPTRLRFVKQPLALFDDLHISPFDHQTVCCTRDSTLSDVIDKFLATGVHRVFVVDDKQKPVGVVSLRDVIACLVIEPKDSRIAEFFAR